MGVSTIWSWCCLRARLPKRPKVTENQVVNDCIRWLFFHGCFVWRNNTGKLRGAGGHWVRFGKKGSGDIIGLTGRGKHIEIECKRPGKDAEDHQKAHGERIEAMGGIYIVATGVEDLEKRKWEIVA